MTKGIENKHENDFVDKTFTRHIMGKIIVRSRSCVKKNGTKASCNIRKKLLIFAIFSYFQ